jgi:hypothetical protein
MKRTIRTLAVAFTMTLVGVAVAQEIEDPVVVKTRGLAPHVAIKVEAEAARGITALRRYVERTRGIHNLHLGSLIATPEEALAMKAKAGQEPTKLARDEVPKSK